MEICLYRWNYGTTTTLSNMVGFNLSSIFCDAVLSGDCGINHIRWNIFLRQRYLK
jgi:hypothetical protein